MSPVEGERNTFRVYNEQRECTNACSASQNLACVSTVQRSTGSAGILSARTADPHRGACFGVETFFAHHTRRLKASPVRPSLPAVVRDYGDDT